MTYGARSYASRGYADFAGLTTPAVSSSTPSSAEFGTGVDTATVQGSYQAVVLADTPLAYYRCDEPSGTTAVDSSGNANNGTYVSPTLGHASLTSDPDPAVLLSGGHLHTPIGMSSWTAFAIEAWVQQVNIPGNARLFANAHNDSSGSGIQVGYISGGGSGLYFCIGTTGGYVRTNISALSNGSTYHLVLSWDGTTLVVYLNGIAIWSPALSGTLSAPDLLDFNWNPDYGGDAGNNIWDEIAIYNHALSAARVQAHYLAGVPTTAISGSDTGTETDAGVVTPVTSVLDSESGSGADASSVVFLDVVSDTDTGQGAEVGALSGLGVHDSGSGADVVQIVVAGYNDFWIGDIPINREGLVQVYP